MTRKHCQQTTKRQRTALAFGITRELARLTLAIKRASTVRDIACLVCKKTPRERKREMKARKGAFGSREKRSNEKRGRGVKRKVTANKIKKIKKKKLPLLSSSSLSSSSSSSSSSSATWPPSRRSAARSRPPPRSTRRPSSARRPLSPPKKLWPFPSWPRRPPSGERRAPSASSREAAPAL